MLKPVRHAAQAASMGLPATNGFLLQGVSQPSAHPHVCLKGTLRRSAEQNANELALIRTFAVMMPLSATSCADAA